MMPNNSTTAALVTADEHVRAIVMESLEDAGPAVEIVVEMSSPAAGLQDNHLDRLRSEDPQVIILDMTDDPDQAIRAASSVAAGNPHAALVGVGPDLDSNLLLEAMRAGVMEYLPRPLQPAAVRDALHRVLRKRGWVEHTGGNRDGQLLSFFSAKGGAGCTSVLVNTAIEIHRITGGRTLVVDLDLELGEIASLLGIQPRFHFVDLVRNFHRMDADLLASYIESHESGIQVLSAPFEPEIGHEVTGDEISRILGFLRTHFDYVLVDASKSLAPPSLAALQAADPICLVTNMDVPSLRNLKRCLPILDRVTAGDPERIRLVVNRYNPKSLVTLKDLEETLGLEVFATLSNDYQTVIESISTGRPLVQHSSAEYAEELKDLAYDLVTPEGDAEEEARAGLMSRILSPFRGNGRRPRAASPAANAAPAVQEA